MQPVARHFAEAQTEYRALDLVQAQAAAQQAAQTNMRTIPTDTTQVMDPSAQQMSGADDQTMQATEMPTQQNASASTPDPAILTLANNNDLDIATLARQADKSKGNEL